ncbi:unnamed protein product [Rotaria sordida]|uniref:Uncharacterized protein n=2 Tax=Rotaria sordida TaxID=392033 RepID=A0A814XWM0_9BILA|nr:unnamed protein product [Rotaria sordida]
MIKDDNNNNNNNNNNNFIEEIDDKNWILEKPISVLALDQADRRVLKVADQRDAVQKKTFTKWMNFYLSKRHGLYVDDLYFDLRDGHLLLSLLEIFTNQTITRERGTSKFHALRNIEQCLQCLEQDHNIRLVNIRPEELVNGNPKLTLGLIWRIILHFQFSDLPLSSSNNENIPINSQQTIPSSSETISIKNSSKNLSIDQVPLNYRNMLLIWARQQCQDYPGIYIEDFTYSWRNGRAFLAILHRHNPHLIDIKQAYCRSNRENLIQAFEFAQKHYGITQLIDPEDVDTDEPDEKSILLYIAYLYKACPTIPIHPLRQEHDRIRLQDELLSRYTNIASNLFKWIKIKLDFLNREIEFKTFEEFQTFENILQIIKNDELSKYNQLLHQLRSIDVELKTLQFHELLQPDIESINLAWNELEINLHRIENDLKKYKRLIIDLDLIERDITNIEIKSKQFDTHTKINHMNDIQIKLDQILNHCQTLLLSNEQTQNLLERIHQLNLRVNIHLTLSSTITNGFHQISKQQTRSSPSTDSEKLNIIVTGDFRQDVNLSQSKNTDLIQSNIKNLIEELYLINSNINILDQLLQKRIKYFLQTDLLTSNDQFFTLYKQHKTISCEQIMQRSFSSSCADHRSSMTTCRHLPIHSACNNNYDYYSSDADSQHHTYLHRTSSTSSFSSTGSTCSASYRILPVRYSSVDRILPKPPIVTSNERGINVRIQFDHPPQHHHHKHHYRHHRQHNIEKSEHHHRKHMTREHQHYGSCPVLDQHYKKSTSLGPSNITCIETRSIVRDNSNEQLNKNNYSNSLTIRDRSKPRSSITSTRIKHIPLDTNVLSTRDFENNLLSHASRIKDIRNHIRQEYNTISHHELRSLVNQTSDHVQNLFTKSKDYSDKLIITETALNLLNTLTSQIIEIETRLLSQKALIDDENYFHRQLNELNELHNQAQILEKSITDLLIQSKQLGNDKLIHISEHLSSRWQQIISEIIQRKRSIKRIIETNRSFKKLFEQEKRLLHHIERRMQSLETITTDRDKLQRMSKTVVDLFNDILYRAQAIEHMNDVAVKLIQEVKMYNKNLKRFRVSIHDTNSNLNASISNKQQQYSSKVQHISRAVSNQVEEFDRHYANLLAHMEEYTRSFVKNSNTIGQIINLPLDSAITIVHLYRTTIATRYNTTGESLFSSSDEDEQSFLSSSVKQNQQNNDETGFIDVSHGKVTVDRNYHYPLSSLDNSVSLETTYVIPTNELSSTFGIDNDLSNNKKVRFIIEKQQPTSSIVKNSRSAYVVDTLEQRNYDLREAYSRGLINSNNHHIIDRATSRELDLGEGLKMGILKVGDPQSYNIISKTESLIISSVFDHRLNTFVDPNIAIRTKILDPYHGLYINNLTQESISIDDAMTKGFIIVEQQHPLQQSSNHHTDKYVISTSLIRETRSYHLLGVRDYLNNKELTVQEAIRLGILDKQNGQYINRKTNEILSISEAIAQGHIRAQPLPVESTTNQDTSGINKRGTVKETKTYTLKSAIHPRTRQEIPIRVAIDEGIIDHAKGYYVNSITGENLPISVAIERGLIFTELLDQHSKRYRKTLIIEQVIDPVTNRRLGVNEAIKIGLLNSNVTTYYHSVTQKQMSILEAYEQGLIIGKFHDQHPSSFYGDQHEQVFYLITGIVDIRTDKIYTLQEGIQQKLFDHKKGVYMHPITGDEINIGDAVKRGFIQVQAVSSQIIFNSTDQILNDKRRTIISQEPYGNINDSRSKLSIRIESQTRPRTPYEINESESLQHDKDVVEIESIQRLPRHKKQHVITREEEIIEQHTKNIVDREIFINRSGINRGKSNERQKQQYIEEVVIDDGIPNNRRAKFDIKEDRHTSHREIVIEGDRYIPPPPKDQLIINGTQREHEVRVVPTTRPPRPISPPRAIHIDDRQREGQRIHHGEIIIDDHQRSYTTPSTTTTTIKKEYIDITDNHVKTPPVQKQQTTDYTVDEQQSWTEEEWEQWHCIMMIKGQPYRVVWVMNTATGDRLPLQNAYQRGLVDTKQRLFYDEKLNRQTYTFEKAVELGYMGIEPDTASLPIHVDGIDYMIHWVLDSSTKRRIFPRQAVRKQILDPTFGRYINPYNKSQVSLHEAIYLKFIGATEYNTINDILTITINGQTYNIKWVYDTRNMKKILPRDALKQGILDIQLNEYRKFDTNDVMTIYDAIQAGYIRCSDDDSSSDNSVRPPSIISIDEDELTIATKTATYVITSVIHPLTQKEIKVSEAIDLGILDKDIGSYRDLVTNVQYELAEAINEGLVYATIIETKEDTEMLTSSVQEIVRKFIVKSVAVDSESQEKIGGLEAQAIGILNYAQGVYHDRKYGVRIPLDKAIEKKLLDVELISQNRFEEYDLELITDTITEKRITLYKIHGVRNNVLDRMESGAVAVKNQIIDTEAKTYTDFSTGETMPIQEAINKRLVDAEISEHVERKPLGLSMQNAIRLGFYVAETGTFRDPATEQYMTLMEAIERGHIHVNGIAFADSEQGPITLYDALSLGLINRRDGGKLNPPKINLYRARLVESKLHRMNVEDAIRCGLLNLRTGFYKHPHSGEQLNLKEAIQRGLIDGQSTIIEHPTSGRFMTLKEALDGIRIDNDGQVIDSYTNKIITTLELAFNHRKLFSQFDVNAGEVFLPLRNESVGFEKAIRKNLLDNNRMKLFDPKTSREYTIQDAIERGLVDSESGLIYDTHTHTQYSIREAIRHGIVAIVGAPLVPIKANHDTVAAKITSRKNRRHSLAKSSLHFDYNSAPDSADEDSQGSGWHRIKSKTRAISPLSFDGRNDLKYNIRRRTGSSPTRTCRDDDWRTRWTGGNNKDDDDDSTFGSGGGGGGSRRFGGNSFYSNVTTQIQQTNNSSDQSQGGQTSSGFQQKQEQLSSLSTVTPKDSSLSNNQENDKSNEPIEIIYDVLSTTKISNDEQSLLSTIDDNNNDILQSSVSIESTSKIQDDENCLILEMHDVAGRLTLLHNQLNQYVYLTENLNELRINVEHIKKLHAEIEKEKSIIHNLIERATNINPQLAILTTDLEDKRIEISDINNGLSNIIERFIVQLDQFNTKYIYLIEWLKTNEKEIENNLQLSTLIIDNDKFKNILNTGINLQNDFISLQEYLQIIDLIIQDFQQATENTDDGKSTMIFKQLQQSLELLSINYFDFLKRCKQISDICERYLILFNEINHLDEEFIKSMNEFDQHLAMNEKNQQDDNILQSLLLNVQQQLDKLRLLSTHEPTSTSTIVALNNHIHNQIKEHLFILLNSHTERYNDAQKRLMHHFELIKRFLHERQTIKERINELYHWLLSSIENDFFSKPLSLNRTKLDEKIINFRQFHAQLRTRQYSFDSDINTTINFEQLFDNDDKNFLKLINEYFQLLNEQSNQYNEHINRLSTRLNEFHLEHTHLIDTYANSIRLYVEQIKQNDDINFSALELLLNNDENLIIDHTLYDQLINDLLETKNIEDKNDILKYKNEVNEYKIHYEKFQNDLKLILQNRQTILNQYDLIRNQIEEFLLTTDRLLKQTLTIDICQDLLTKHSKLPIEQLKIITEQLINFYSSPNLLNLYEQLKLSKPINHSNLTLIYQKQTDDLIEYYLAIKQQLLQYIELLENIQQKTNQYQLIKQIAENSIEKAKQLVTIDETILLPLDSEQIIIMLQKYKDIGDQLRTMSSTIDEYKDIGVTLINMAQRYIDTDIIENEITSIDKTWSEYVEYIFDTIDYIQLHQEDLHEFYQLANNLLVLLNEKQIQIKTIKDDELKNFHDEIENLNEQIELLNQKGELLLQSSTIDSNDNQIEHLLETINRNYDSLTIKIKIPLDNINEIHQSTTTTTTDNISSIPSNQFVDELHHHMNEIDLTMNELSELLVSSTNDAISSQPIKLTEQLLDNTVIHNELEKRKHALEQLYSNIETFKPMITNTEDMDSIKVLDEKLALLNQHWLIMKQTNELREENLLLTQVCSNKFWSEYNELSIILNNISQQLLQIRPRSSSRQYLENEQEKYNQLIKDFSNNEIKYQDILQKYSLQLLTLISSNQQETDDIYRYLYELEQQWKHLEIDLNTCQQELTQSMIKSNELNTKLENVSTWFNDKSSFTTNIGTNNELEDIRIFKEHLDDKYIDIINLKQDYTDIEQQNEFIIEEKPNIVEEQFVEIDSKWAQLKDKIQEQKTLIYETALHQNRIGDVIADITQSLDACAIKLSVLINNSSDINLIDIKQIEIFIAKFRILLNDIELISYDIEQLKQNNYEDKNTILLINNRWEELLKQTNEKYNLLENKLQEIKFQQKLFDQIYYELNLIDKQINESTIHTKYSLIIERLELIERQINKEFTDDNNEQIKDLKQHLIDVKQRTLKKGQELLELTHSIELFHTLLKKSTDFLTESERYLNTQKPIQRRFALYQTLLKQIDEHKIFQNQLETYKQYFIDLDKLAIHLKYILPKNDSIYIRNSLISVQTRWQNILTRANQKMKELEKAIQTAKKIVQPVVADIDRIKSEVNRQTSLCQCSKKYDVQQIAEGRYRFGESQSLRLVRILRSTVMVRVGGGWTALDEFLVRHDPCRAKGRTNYELHPENYALRDGVAQTMTFFKPRLVTVHQPTCVFHQQQQSTGSLKQSSIATPTKSLKDKSNRTSSTISLTQQQQQQNSSSNGDLSVSREDLSTSPHILSDSETRPSLIPIPIPMYTPATSTLSRTSSRESILSEQSCASTSSTTQQRRPNMCPLEYRIIDPNHTFCSKPFPNVIDQRVTSSERSYIINMHNYERRRAYGTNIEKMYWNDDLAEIALRHARTCIFEHDKINQRNVPKIPLSTGQNLAMGYENWIEVIEGWSEEKEYYYHAFPSTHIFSHYTQMIWHSSVLIGCAATICPPFGTHNIPWRFFICNYITGMLNSNYHEAFKPSIEYHPLHDCQGKVCLYNGTLDLNTCKCQCSTYASGLQCEKLNCSMLPSCPYHSSVSCIAVDVPLECPRLCGLCDRYEILKNIYGEENLTSTIIFTTNEKSQYNDRDQIDPGHVFA